MEPCATNDTSSNPWKPREMRNCTCSHCGGNAEPLLSSSGQLGARLDKMIVAHEADTGKPITVKDLRVAPKRPRHSPELTLGAALIPLMAAIMLKLSPGMMSWVGEMANAPGAYSGHQLQFQEFFQQLTNHVLPWVCGIASALMLANAVWKVIDNQRMIEEEAREIRLANQLMALRRKADPVTTCGWCNQMSAPGHDKLEIRPDLLRAVIEEQTLPVNSVKFPSRSEQEAYFAG